MTSNEADFSKAIQTAMNYLGWECQSHEDKISNFIPDLSFSANKMDGWMELKWCNEEPGTLNSIDHWTKGQEDFLTRRGKVGSGLCFLVLGTPKQVYAWKWDKLARVRHVPFVAAASDATFKKAHPHEIIRVMDRAMALRAGVLGVW